MSEQILKDVSNATGLRHVILRYFNVAGADPEGRIGQRTPDATHLIKVACEAAIGKRPELAIYGNDYPTPDGTCIRDYIHVEDLAAAHLKALEYLERGGHNITLNSGYGRGFSVKEVIATVKKVSGKNFSVREVARRPGDVVRVVAQTDAIRSTLGWEPRYDNLQTIVEHAWQWEQKLTGL
jgi:UDP-glucose 4-epimerase